LPSTRTGEQVLADLDPWAGFTRFVATLCALAAKDLGFYELTSIDRRPEARRPPSDRTSISSGSGY
jgi:hypothetical protein